jgi:hypothetical protein
VVRRTDPDDVLRTEGGDALRAQWDAGSTRARNRTEGEAKLNGINGQHYHGPSRATLYEAPDPATIPRRAWLYGGHYVRGVVTATVAPGGHGKTTLALFECIAMAVNGLRVWYLSGEDPKVEVDRRIAAHCQQHGIDLSALDGRLYVDDRESFPFSIGKSRRNATVEFNEEAVRAFETAIVTDQIDVAVLDPFVGFHSVSEVDNNAIDAIVKRLGGISQRQNCCIEISHHVRKPAQGQVELTVDDTRGGSAIVNAVRSCRVINRMSSVEAEQAKIETKSRHLYIRIDLGKRNMAPPEVAEWFRIVSTHLPNGDNVQAITHWEFPKAFDGMSAETVTWVQTLVREREGEGNPLRADSRSPDWLGIPLAEKLGIDPSQRGSAIRMNTIIGTWIKNNVFKKEQRYDGKLRKQRLFYVCSDRTAGGSSSLADDGDDEQDV